MDSKAKRPLRAAAPVDGDAPGALPGDIPRNRPPAIRSETPAETPAETAAETAAEMPAEATEKVTREIRPAMPETARAAIAAALSPPAGPMLARALPTASAPAPAGPPTNPPAARVPAAAPDRVGNFGRDTWAALAASQTAMMRGFEALSEAMAGLARTGIDAAARATIEMIQVKTLSDAVAVNAGLVRIGFDTLIGSSAQLSDLGAKLAAGPPRA